MRVDDGGVPPDQHRMEVEPVREAADDGELVVVRRGLGRPGGCSGKGVPVRRNDAARIVVGNFRIVDVGSVGTALRRARRHRQVQTVHTLARSLVVDPDPSLLPNGGHLVESELEMGVHIDGLGPIEGMEPGRGSVGTGDGQDGRLQEKDGGEEMSGWMHADGGLSILFDPFVPDDSAPVHAEGEVVGVPVPVGVRDHVARNVLFLGLHGLHVGR